MVLKWRDLLNGGVLNWRDHCSRLVGCFSGLSNFQETGSSSDNVQWLLLLPTLPVSVSGTVRVKALPVTTPISVRPTHSGARTMHSWSTF